MKKNNFVQGAFIASLGIVICKILGIIYVIPFYKIVGTQGGALYGYAYAFYDLFTSLATVGLPFAISKIVSEYYTLGYYKKKEEVYHIGLKLTVALSIICLVALYLFAPIFAYQIMGTAQGGNTVEDITTVIRVSALSLVFVSVLSIMKGYLQGHKYIAVTSISQVVEQIVRVTFIIVGSYLALNMWHLGLTNSVSIAVFGASVGAMAAIGYLLFKMHQAKELKVKDYKESDDEKAITTKTMIKKLAYYAFPFLLIACMTSGYQMIDMFTVGPTLRRLGFSTVVSEAIVSDMTTWGSKLLSIVQAVVSGFCISLIPHISASFAQKDMNDVEKKINKTYQMTLFLVIPMCIGLSFLAQPVWQAFYGVTQYGPSVFMFLILSEIPAALFLVTLVILQALNMHKEVFISLLVGLVYNAAMNIPTMNFCYSVGLPVYYGATLASIIGYILSIIIAMYSLNKKYKINFKPTYKIGFNIVIANLIMLASLFILNFIFPINVSTRSMSIIVIIVYALVGSIVYALVTYKGNIMLNIFGKEELNKILKHIPFVKKYVKE